MDNIRKKVINVMEQTLNDDTLHTKFAESEELSILQLNSISYIKLVVDLENEFDIEFDDELLDLTKFKLLNQICEYIATLIS